ncbi:MAG TPA: DoxX family protein [Pyrinomonadaceae bacterium]|nr:DoxX family protein [Pyrinomonadaceae bacterium]
MNIVLWIIQVVVALLFLFSGGTKLVMSAKAMQDMAPPGSIMLPGLFIKFLGGVEVLGGLGLLLPGLTKIRRGLTPLAAIGLLIIMIGAVVVSLMGPGASTAILPFVTGILCIVIAYGRRDWR